MLTRHGLLEQVREIGEDISSLRTIIALNLKSGVYSQPPDKIDEIRKSLFAAHSYILDAVEEIKELFNLV